MFDFVFPQLIRTEFETFAVKQNASSELLLEKNSTRLNEDLFNVEPEYFKLIFKRLLQQSFTVTGLDVQPNANVLEQVIKVNRIPAYYVKYTYEQNNYGLTVLSKDKTVFEETGPITLFRKNLIQNAHKLLNRRNYGKSAEFADMAVKMGLDLKDPILEKINKKITIKIKASYKIGAFIGAWTSAYISALFILSFFKTPKYILEVLNDTVLNWGTRFLVSNNVMLVIVITIIGLTKCIKLADREMFPFPGMDMKPEILRFAFGLVVSMFYTAFIASTILLLNATGILIPFTRVIALAVEALVPLIPIEIVKNPF